MGLKLRSLHCYFWANDRLNWQIINTAIQVTSEPAQAAATIKKNLTHKFIMNSQVFTITVLDGSTPLTSIGTFGFRLGRNQQRVVPLSRRAKMQPLLATGQSQFRPAAALL